MNLFERKVLFDHANYELVHAVDNVVAGKAAWQLVDSRLKLHPRGIRELSEVRSVRLACTMLNLLDTFEAGNSALERRLDALQALKDELSAISDVPFPLNTSRVIVQIIKQLVREKNDFFRRLHLAHDLRDALLGNPLFIRKLLRRYHLVEMPEKWEPVSFDQHVHDANTKGRKSPTHLIMDAWVKGIRKIEVIYYNFVPLAAAEELLRAASIMNMSVRIGVEYKTLYRGKFVEMIWSPRGFSGITDYMNFLRRVEESEFFRKCQDAAVYRRRMVLDTLERFNQQELEKFNAAYKVAFAAISEEDFLASVQYGQPELEHVGEYLASLLKKQLSAELAQLQKEQRSEDRCREITELLEMVSSEWIMEKHLDRSIVDQVPEDVEVLPELNRYTPRQLVEELRKFPAAFRITLNLSKLSLPDVIELLYLCQGGISTLEIFNLKDQLNGENDACKAINKLRIALNNGAVFALKNLLFQAIEESSSDEQKQILHDILKDLSGFIRFYKHSELGATLGSDSASHASRLAHGMGLVVVESLPGRVRRAFARGKMFELQRVPVCASIYKSINFFAGGERKVEFHCPDPAAKIGCKEGNVATLGGGMPPVERELLRHPIKQLTDWWTYLNSDIKIFLKIAVGFFAAFFTFYFTNTQWWVLMYFGAPIWFGITAVRNMIQLVASGGGWRSSPLLKWNEFISWQRISDSLFFTGLSVPLLDYVVKTLLLQHICGLTTENAPILVFTGIALANGCYIAGHNLLRAFPHSAVVGNFFRAPLAIPLAIFINFMLTMLLEKAGVENAAGLMQQSAAIISKLASDIVGGIIESRADCKKYIAARTSDYKTKLFELFELYSKLELNQPDKSEINFTSPAQLQKTANDNTLLYRLYANVLDQMYMWMRQPRSRSALKQLLKTSSPAERSRLLACQDILENESTIADLFLKGIFGEKFSRPLAFYLHYHSDYQNEFRQFIQKMDRRK